MKPIRRTIWTRPYATLVSPTTFGSLSFLFREVFLLMRCVPIMFCTLCRSSCYFLFSHFLQHSFRDHSRDVCNLRWVFFFFFGLLMEKFLLSLKLYFFFFRGTSPLFGLWQTVWSMNLFSLTLFVTTHKNPFIGLLFIQWTFLPKQVMHETFFSPKY